MKKNITKILFAFAFLPLVLASCEQQEDPNKREYAEAWTADAAEHWHACTTPGHEDEKGDRGQHTFDNGVVTNPTYEAAGYTTFTCTVCGYSYQDNYTRALTHNYANTWSVDETNGTHYHACTDAGYETLRADEARHTWDDGVITAATYEAAGFITYTCTECHATRVESGEAQLQHHYSALWSKNETHHWHDCVDEGYTDLKSGLEAHDFEEETIPATMYNPEYIIHTCKVCKYAYTTTTDGSIIEHHYETGWTYNDHTHWHACTDEGYSNLKGDEAAHDFDNGVVTHATYESAGYITYTCQTCGYSYQEQGEAQKTHNYSTEWSIDSVKGTHYHACTDEGYETLRADEGAHTYSEVVVPSTYTDKGSITYTCTVCGHSYSEETEVLTHNYSSSWSYSSTHHWHGCTDVGYDTTSGDESRYATEPGLFKDYEAHDCVVEVHPATYEQAGYTSHTCACGYSYIDGQTEPLEHTTENNLVFAKNEFSTGYLVTGTVGEVPEVIYIPRTHTVGNETLPVVGIEEFAFQNVSAIKEVVMAEGLTNIGRSAFAGCYNLRKITIGADVSAIESGAFTNCYAMTEIYNLSALNIKVGSSTFGSIAKYAAAVVKTAANLGSFVTEGNEEIYTAKDGTKWLVSYKQPAQAVNTIELSEGITSIKANAFRGVINFESVDLTGITYIGEGAFFDSSIVRVTIPASVSKMGEAVFANSALEQAVVQNNIIYAREFENSCLYDITLSESTTTIQYSAFKESCVPTIDLTHVTSIGEGAFYDSCLENVTIPATLTTIGDSAFFNCIDLEEIEVSTANENYSSADGVLFNKAGTTLITYPAGKDNTSYEVASGVTTISGGAFHGARYESITIGKDVSNIGPLAFRWNRSLTSFSVDGDNGSYKAKEGVLYSKDGRYLINYPMQKKNGSFQVNDGVKYIEPAAFEGNSYLTSVTISGCAGGYIGANAFAHCSILKAITLVASGSGITIYENCFTDADVQVFNYTGTNATNFMILTTSAAKLHDGNIADIVCSELQGDNPSTLTGLAWSSNEENYVPAAPNSVLTIPHGVTEIAPQMFAMTGYTKVIIPFSVKVIHDQAFAMCKALTEVEFASGSQLQEIGDQAFALTAVTSIEIPATVKSIGDQAFAQSALETLTFGENSQLESIGDQAFAQTSLTSVALPATVKSIGDQAFAQSTLSAITFGTNSQLETIGEQAFAMTPLASVTLPDGLKSIGGQAFALTYVGYATSYTINIPESVESIGYGAFAGCGALASITVDAGNETFVAVDGVLFQKVEVAPSVFMKVMLAYPAGRPGDTYEVPADVVGVPAAFLGAQNLKDVTFATGSMIQTIHEQAFAQSNIETIVIPASVTEIQAQAFGECAHLNSVTFDTGSVLETIGDQAFAKTAITAIDLPESVTSIGEQAFAQTALQSITFNNTGALTIGKQAFGECTGLQSVIFSGTGNVSIGLQAFAGCITMSGGVPSNGLSYVVLSTGVISIGDQVFYGDILVSNAQEYVPALDGYTHPLFYLGSPTDWASVELGAQYGLTYYEEDEHGNVVALYVLNGVSFYSETAPTDEQKAAATAGGFTWWHYVDVGGGIYLPTVWAN